MASGRTPYRKKVMMPAMAEVSAADISTTT